MKASEAIVAWTPNRGHWADKETAGMVAVGPFMDAASDVDWTAVYAMTGGAANVSRRKMKGPLQKMMVFVEFNTLVVRDGIDPNDAHKAFLKIDEYAETISPDIPGARGDNNDVL